MGLLYLAEIGVKSLKNSNDNLKDSEQFVETCINIYGEEEFQFASERLRSDAEFILKFVKKHPKILKFCQPKIYDSYIEDDFIIVEEPMDELLFATKCCNENIEAFRYLPQSAALKYYRAVKSGVEVVGEYHGKEESYKLRNDKEFLHGIEFLRFGILRYEI